MLLVQREVGIIRSRWWRVLVHIVGIRATWNRWWDCKRRGTRPIKRGEGGEEEREKGEHSDQRICRKKQRMRRSAIRVPSYNELFYRNPAKLSLA